MKVRLIISNIIYDDQEMKSRWNKLKGEKGLLTFSTSYSLTGKTFITASFKPFDTDFGYETIRYNIDSVRKNKDGTYTITSTKGNKFRFEVIR